MYVYKGVIGVIQTFHFYNVWSRENEGQGYIKGVKTSLITYLKDKRKTNFSTFSYYYNLNSTQI